jgi:hypothetical protein
VMRGGKNSFDFPGKYVAWEKGIFDVCGAE